MDIMDKALNTEYSKDEFNEFEMIDILGNGLVIKKVLKKGLRQDNRPSHGDSVVISYKGWLEDGSLVEKVENFSMVIGDGECIHAFDLALPLAELKEVFELKTDSRFAYGNMGKLPEIPGNSKLTYHVTLNECGDPPRYENLPPKERLKIANMKYRCGNFYFYRKEFQFALTCYTNGIEVLMKQSQVPTTSFSEAPSCDLGPDIAFQLKDLEINLKNSVVATQLKLEAFKDAVKTCDSVLLLDPTNRKALYRKGQALVGTGNFLEAIQAYEEALQIDPSSPFLRKSLRQAKRAFKVNEKTGFCGRLKEIMSRHKIAISAGVLAGLSVMIGGTVFFLNGQ